MKVAENIQLASFFTQLAVKRKIAPNLHVRPLVAELFLTENCNLRCKSCSCWLENTKDELTTDEWKDVLRQLAELRILKANFTGGEPLIRPDAIELMAFARDLGMRRMHLNTNGIRLTPGTVQDVLAAGVRSFNISVDGPNGLVHDRIRGRLGAFETTITHLRNLIEQRDSLKLKVRMNFTVMRDNIDHLPDIARLAQELRVQLYLNLATDHTFLFRAPEVSRQKVLDSGEIAAALGKLEAVKRADPHWLPRYSDLNYIPGHFSEVVQRDVPCAESQLKLMIHSRGEIGGCWAHDPAFNIRQRPITEVIESAHYREEHARLFRKDCAGCGSNYSLNLRWRPTTYLDDLLWRAGRKQLGHIQEKER
ncbi:MAG TPA: radical SAM protein [Streptosporangiaceae bacterium]